MTYDDFKACDPGTPVSLADGKFGSLIDTLHHISGTAPNNRAAIRVCGEAVARFIPIVHLVDLRRGKGLLVQLPEDPS